MRESAGFAQERDRQCRRQAMLAAQMQKRADKAVAAVSIIITAARPVAVVGRCLTPIGLTTFRTLSNPQALHFTRGGGVFSA